MKLQKDYQLIVDLWRLFRNYQPVRKDDEYWQSLLEQAKEFASQHGDTELSKDLVMAVVIEIERRMKTT